MVEYWESKFKNEGAVWQYEPADSAFYALDLFRLNSITKILIPGFGYGRNAKLFLENGFEVTGIELSESAIKIAKEKGMKCNVHHGSVTGMPFDNEVYQGIFCYALIHLLSKDERIRFLENCYHQLADEGIMVFTVVSTEAEMYGTGKLLSENYYELSPGLTVFFYDDESIENEFKGFGLVECVDIAEPIKFIKDQEPLKCKFVICKKSKD